MKKSWLVLLLVTVLALAACGHISNSNTSTPSANPTLSPTNGVASTVGAADTGNLSAPTGPTPASPVTPTPLASATVDPLDGQLSNLNQIINDTSGSLSGAAAGQAGGE